MKRRHTCQESEEKWKQLLALSQFGTKHHDINSGKKTISDQDENELLFDCQSMEAPTTRPLVEGVLEEFAAKWRALDDRRIIQQQQEQKQQDTNDDDDDSERMPPPKRKYRRGGWEHTQEQLLTLPKNFDYTTSRESPPSPSPNDPNDKVIDLLNPTRHDSYHQELWKLFQQIPTLEELKETSRANAQIPHSLALHSEIVEGTKKVHRMDAHALCRLRMSHRHGLPPPPATTTTTQTTTTTTAAATAKTAAKVGTVRFEFWRRQPKRGSGPDTRRMVLEFLSSQTLLEVHKAIVGMTEDDGWASQQDTTDGGCFFIEETFYTTNGEAEDECGKTNCDNDAATTSNTAADTDTDTDTDRPAEIDTAEKSGATSVTAPTNEDDDDENDGDNSNGVANNNAPTTASNDTGMDYMTAIVQWLDGGGIPNPTRRQYLGIATSNRFRTPGTPMKDAILKDIPFRLGVRYYHVMHGDVECSMMVTDKRLVPITNPKTQYPIIHDIWVPNYPVPICEACDRFAAVYVYFHRGTAARNYQDGEPTALCDKCCKALKLLEKERDALQLYHVWKNKFELSTAMVRSEQCRFF